jgi:hypothetical protein
MKTKLFSLALLSLTSVLVASLNAGTPEQEKAFVDKYKTAFEAGDKATLESFLYTKGAHPMALEFFKMMQSESAGKKISSIELVDLSPEEAKKAEGTQEGPGGEKMKMTLKPTKKLKISVDSKDESGSSSSSTENLVAEKDGKFYIPVPGPAK